MLEFLSGKKTYLVALGFTLYAAFGWWMGHLTADAAITLINVNGVGALLRAGVAKV
jgi:hypothetical protein